MIELFLIIRGRCPSGGRGQRRGRGGARGRGLGGVHRELELELGGRGVVQGHSRVPTHVSEGHFHSAVQQRDLSETMRSRMGLLRGGGSGEQVILVRANEQDVKQEGNDPAET